MIDNLEERKAVGVGFFSKFERGCWGGLWITFGVFFPSLGQDGADMRLTIHPLWRMITSQEWSAWCTIRLEGLIAACTGLGNRLG